MVSDEAGGGNEEVVHPVEASADGLRVNGVVGHSSTGLIDHLEEELGGVKAHNPKRVIFVVCVLFFV